MKKLFFALSCIMSMLGLTSCEIEHHDRRAPVQEDTTPASPTTTERTNGTTINR